MKVSMTRVCLVLSGCLLLISCGVEKPQSVSRRVRDLQRADVDSFKGKTIGTVLSSLADSVEDVYISHEPPGYLHSVSYYFSDGYCLDFLVGRPRFQEYYSENQLWDTLSLQFEIIREASLRHHRDILYGKRFN